MSFPAKRRTQMDRSNIARTALIEAAIFLLSEKGYASATTAAIARHAQMTTGSLHYHFGSKDDLFIAVLDQLTVEVLALFEQMDEADLESSSAAQLLVTSLWSVYGSARYWAVWEINMGFRPSPEKHSVLVNHRLATRDKMFQVIASNDNLHPLTREVFVGVLPFLLSCIRGVFLDTYFTGHGDQYLQEQLSVLTGVLDEKLQAVAHSNTYNR